MVVEVEFGIVAGVSLPHFPDDFEPALAQGTKGQGVAFSAFDEVLVIEGSPCALGAAMVGQKIHGLAQVLVTGAADFDLLDFAGLEADRSGASDTLEALDTVIAGAIAADL